MDEPGGRQKMYHDLKAESLSALIAVARGEQPATLVLKNSRVVNVLSGDIHRADIAVVGDLVAGVGEYSWSEKVIDLKGKFVLPGLLDGHIHLESSMLTPEGFAEAVIPHGTTAVVADPHEIVNVCGMEGFMYMVEASRGLPVDVFINIPSCVPATAMETAGAVFGAAEIKEAWQRYPRAPALAEMMNYPGVIHRIPEIMEKIICARSLGKPVDGHAPLLGGKELAAYLAAGISSDHESSRADEALEKLRLGAAIAVRDGSAAGNLAALLPVINEYNASQFFFCSDDRHPADLLAEGHVDATLRRAVNLGLDPIRAVQMATINPVRHYGLGLRGAVAPGYLADLVVVPDLQSFAVEMVFKNGALVASGGNPANIQVRKDIAPVAGTVRIPALKGRLNPPLPPAADEAVARVIEMIPGQILTGCREMSKDEIAGDPDVNLIAVVERHGRNGNVSVGYVKGFGPLAGALVSTVAHDSHNLILIGSDQLAMSRGATAVREMGGGMVVMGEAGVLASLPLPAAGLMSNRQAGEVAGAVNELHRAAAAIGCTLQDPFMQMSFLSLPVIPSLKITDVGLVDVEKFELVDLWQAAGV